MGIVGVIAALWLFGPPAPSPAASAPAAPAPPPVVAPAPPAPPVASAPRPAPQAWFIVRAPAEARPPLYKRPAFWTGIGLVAAGVIALAVLASRSGPEPYAGNLQPGVWTLP